MADAKHTPGPWRMSDMDTSEWIGESAHAIDAVDPEDRRVFEIAAVWGADRYHVADERSLANARLIATAPELLEELRDLIELADTAMHAANRDGSEYDTDAELASARAAVAKATGSVS